MVIYTESITAFGRATYYPKLIWDIRPHWIRISGLDRRDYIKVLSAATLPGIRYHDLRHTAASLILNHGVPALVVSKIRGHSNPSVTLSIYAHSTLDMQSEAARIMEEIVTPTRVVFPEPEVVEMK